MNHMTMATRLESPTPEILQAMAELCLCLGNAFLPPRDADFRLGMIDALCDDLRELDGILAFAGPGQIEHLSERLRSLPPEQEDLLRIYSRLFLSPPTPATLNAGVFLDGNIMGQAALGMESLYQKYQLAKDSGFRDLPDHLSLQLQFIAYLLALPVEKDAPGDALLDASEFISAYMTPWLPALAEQCARAEHDHHLPDIYSRLAELVHRALDRIRPDLPLPRAAGVVQAGADLHRPTMEPPQGEPVACCRCGKPFLVDNELSNLISRLTSQGLDASHLSVCAQCRTGSLGLHPMTPPQAKKPGRG
ncbi:TorD/DmsD family molecular chaperone [Thioalkalivibrio sulfidiphilus]|uniref:TorD/DmsD family molecular chaperone n=1 Tax=Thioalkalivibrio sulfidiphilus TaxID=1033854 RepID=UPI00035FA5B8|nr:molecular chaperone TorD family protein [Thioalkalivibrio sulfidiphilus]